MHAGEAGAPAQTAMQPSTALPQVRMLQPLWLTAAAWQWR